MPYYLLTGAGFSRNWGGLLANEVFEYLLGSPLIDPPLRGLLWRFKEGGQGFEDVLGHLQIEHDRRWSAQTEQDLRNLTSVLYQMFGEMNIGFAGRQFEPQQGVGLNARESITGFLGRFSSIFTLNQDTLLEQKYASNQAQGFYLPGFEKTGETLSVNSTHRPFTLYKPSAEFNLRKGAQAYFKLHGSSNLFDGDRGMMLIMGTNKLTALERQPILRWYLGEFERQLKEPNSKLMVIGYSFSDLHVNAIISTAVKCGLKLFIVDPAGVDAIDKRKSDQPGLYSLYADLKDHIEGASRRPLLSVFGKNDPVEFNKIQRFFRLAA